MYSGKSLHQPAGQHAQVARGGDVAGLSQAFGVFVAGAIHAPGPSLVVHQLDEVFIRAAHAFGQRHGGVVARLDDHALEQVVHRQFRILGSMNMRELASSRRARSRAASGLA